jgi:hypothetical protein
MKWLRTAGWATFALAAASSVCALGLRDLHWSTALVFFGVPWAVRLFLTVISWFLIRPAGWKWNAVFALLIIHSFLQAAASFRWKDAPTPRVGDFEVTLWNGGRNIQKMDRMWPQLAGAETKLIVLIEAGPFPGDAWSRFVAANPDFQWQRCTGGIVVGVKGELLEVQELGNRPRFRCHKVRVEIDATEYAVVAVDIPSQPWFARAPYLDRIREISPPQNCLILGDFNTPPAARGFDAWQEHFSLANDAHVKGFKETWCYGLPVLTLDQLWLSKDLIPLNASSQATLRSDHLRMNFRVRQK